MSIDFKTTGADDGFNHSEAIQPYDNGESADQTVLRRPPENLRTRTEELRYKVNQLEMVMQSDRGLCLVGESSVQLTWDQVTGKISSLSGDFYLVPMISMANGADNGVAISTKYFYSQGGNTFQVVADPALRAYLGSNDLYFKIFKNGRSLVTPVVTVEGADGGGTYPQDGPILIAVEIDKDGTHTLQNVVDAINVASLPYLDAANTIVLSGGANAVTEISERRFYTDAGGQGGVDIEAHKITSTDLMAFFNTHTMNDGDTLVINYANAVDRLSNEAGSAMSGMFEIITGPLTRRLTFTPATYTDVVLAGAAPGTIVGLGSASDGTLVSYDNTNHVWIVKADAASDNFPVGDTIHLVAPDVGQGTIVTSTTADSRNIAEGHVIPLFKRFGDMLHCINGRAFEDGKEDYLISTTNSVNFTNLASFDGTPYGDYMVGCEAKTSTNFTLTANTLNSQLKQIVALGNTAPASGDTKIGAVAKTASGGTITWNVPVGTVNSQIQHIVASLVADAGPSGAGHIGAITKTGTGGAAWTLANTSVDTQLQNILNDLTANSALPNSGDVKIGAFTKTSAAGVSWTLDPGTVNSQVKALVDNLAATTGTSGDARVGGDTKTVSPLTCAAGSLNTQLKGLITDVAAHLNATLYQHKLKQVTDRPFVIVNQTAGSGDYQTIAAAFAALATTGGIIFVQKGASAYGDEIISANVQLPITVVSHGAQIQATTARGLNFTGTITAPISFIGFEFLSTGNNIVVYGNVAPGTNEAVIIFEKCVFDMTGSISGTYGCYDGVHPVIFRDCAFTGSAYNTSATAISIRDHSAGARVEIYDCEFYNLGSVLGITSSGLGNPVCVTIDNNRIRNCGYSYSVFPGRLISLNTAYVYCTVTNNSVINTSGIPANSATFLYSAENPLPVHVCGNTITHGCMDVGAVTGKYNIQLDNLGTSNAEHIVSGNIITNCGDVGGILALGRIVNNYIGDFGPSTDDSVCAIAVPYGSSGHRGGSVVSGNTIDIAVPVDGATVIRLGYAHPNGCADTQCTGNNITGTAGANTIGIKLNGPNGAVVSGNTLAIASAVGISVEMVLSTLVGKNFVINGNVISGASVGIQLTGGSWTYRLRQFTISGNTVTLPATGTPIGIQLVDHIINGNVTGNTVYGRNSGDIGIEMGAVTRTDVTNCGLSGNACFNCADSIFVYDDSNGIGGTPTPRDITINWYDT